MSETVGIVTFPGACDDRDAAHAVELMGGEPVVLWHADDDLKGVDAVLIPGGFSYGDHLRPGAIAEPCDPTRRSNFAATTRCCASITRHRGCPGALRETP